MIPDEALSLLMKLTLLLAVALLVDFVLRRHSILATAALWNAVLLAIVVLPVATLIGPSWRLPGSSPLLTGPDRVSDAMGRMPFVADNSKRLEVRLAPVAPSDGAQADPTKVSDGEATEIAVEDEHDVAAILAWGYAIGVTLALTRLAADARAVAVLRRSALAVDNPVWLERFAFWQGPDGLGTSAPHEVPQLLYSDRIDVPVALGILSPAIVIPAGMARCTARAVIDSALLHELAHLRRRDCAWQLLQRLVEVALWFHPLLWLASRRIAFIRERACDDFAMHALGGFQEYSETLLDVASAVTRKGSVGLGMAVARSGNLARRLAAIERSRGSDTCLASSALRCGFAAAGLICAIVLGAVA